VAQNTRTAGKTVIFN